MPKANKTKKQIKVRDLKPTKDAKGGGSLATTNHQNQNLGKNFLGTIPH
jgi:hypothetical protein